MNYIAIDIGGTKTLLAVFNADGQITEELRFPTPKKYTEFLNILKQTSYKLKISTEEVLAVGIGCPGLVDRKNMTLLSGGGNLEWQGFPLLLGADIGHIFACPNTILENDANLAGLSESQYLIDRYKKAYYLTISTGIGGVYIVDGKIDAETANTEPGQTVYVHENRYTTWEKIASGKALYEKYGQRASDITDEKIWHSTAKLLAPGIINIARIITPEVFIIGGGMGAHLEKYEKHLQFWFDELSTSAAFAMPPLLKAQKPEEAVIYGAYLLARQSFNS